MESAPLAAVEVIQDALKTIIAWEGVTFTPFVTKTKTRLEKVTISNKKKASSFKKSLDEYFNKVKDLKEGIEDVNGKLTTKVSLAYDMISRRSPSELVLKVILLTYKQDNPRVWLSSLATFRAGRKGTGTGIPVFLEVTGVEMITGSKLVLKAILLSHPEDNPHKWLLSMPNFRAGRKGTKEGAPACVAALWTMTELLTRSSGFSWPKQMQNMGISESESTLQAWTRNLRFEKFTNAEQRFLNRHMQQVVDEFNNLLPVYLDQENTLRHL
ncbi:MAG: hypothetical protein Q9167_003650 [Letrouitia subvulpina]